MTTAPLVPVLVHLTPELLEALDQLYPKSGLRRPPSRAAVIRDAIAAHVEAKRSGGASR
jgi:metal-responsive CopG/Arc/MetJ family transcriptional regulator